MLSFQLNIHRKDLFNLTPKQSALATFWQKLQSLLLQGFIRLVARVGSGDPVRVLRLYTTNTLDEVCSIYC